MQERIKVVILIIVASVDSRPIMWMEGPEEYVLQDYDNFVLSPKEINRYRYDMTSASSTLKLERIDPTPIILPDQTLRDLAEKKLDNKTIKTIGKLMRQGFSLRNALQEVVKTTTTSPAPETTSIYIEEIFSTPLFTPETILTTLPNIKQDKTLKLTNYSLDEQNDNLTGNDRPLRQGAQNGISGQNESEGDDKMMNNAANDDDRGARQESSEESEEDDEGGGGGGFGGLISAFLSSLSRPDGGVDVDAIAALIGSLSTQNDDGSFDFNGLTELLMSFFGGDEEGGGGSDIGRFLGGLIGAVIKGVAQPPGAKGAGIFAGKVLGGILPALSAPGATESPTDKPDAGGFVTGLLGSLSAGSGGNGNAGGGGSKFPFIKSVIGIITSILSSSSSSSSKSW